MSETLLLRDEVVESSIAWMTNSVTTMGERMRVPSLAFDSLIGISEFVCTFLRCVGIARQSLIDGAEGRIRDLRGIADAGRAIDAGIAGALAFGQQSIVEQGSSAKSIGRKDAPQ